MALGGCRSQGCHGYLMSTCGSLSLLRYLPHTHLLVMSFKKVIVNDLIIFVSA